MTKDYYNILGVTESNTIEEIKLAYRKLARRWHPDVAGNSDEVMMKFKDINEAYDILSDKIKKEEYDKIRSFYSYSSKNKKQQTYSKQTKQSKSQTKENKYFSFDWENFIPKNYKYNFNDKNFQNTAKKGRDLNTDIEITVFEAVTGTIKVINLLQTKTCPKCMGRKSANGNVCKNCSGKGEVREYKKFRINIPAGINNGSKIRLSGEGEPGINGGKNGDLYITVYVNDKLNYKTEGLNIYKTVSVEPYRAVLGGEISVMTLKGQVNVKLVPNTQNGQKIRLTGCGIVQSKNVGDMIITVEIKIPNKTTEEEIKLYKKLEKLAEQHLRDEI